MTQLHIVPLKVLVMLGEPQGHDRPGGQSGGHSAAGGANLPGAVTPMAPDCPLGHHHHQPDHNLRPILRPACNCAAIQPSQAMPLLCNQQVQSSEGYRHTADGTLSRALQRASRC
jgi:hypothetical protein